MVLEKTPQTNQALNYVQLILMTDENTVSLVHKRILKLLQILQLQVIYNYGLNIFYSIDTFFQN